MTVAVVPAVKVTSPPLMDDGMGVELASRTVVAMAGSTVGLAVDVDVEVGLAGTVRGVGVFAVRVALPGKGVVEAVGE